MRLLPLPPGQPPRPWQLEALAAAREAFRPPAPGEDKREYRSIVLSAATGTGKGSLAAGIPVLTARRGGRVLVLAHRKELIEDVAERVRKVVGAPDVGIVKAERNEWLNPIVVASVQSITPARRKQMGRFDLVVTDECFPAGTPIRMGDGSKRAIEDVRVGDLVLAFDEAVGAFVVEAVEETFSRPAGLLVAVLLADGRRLVCTPNHPVFTARGWVPAGDLTPEDLVAVFDGAQHEVRPVRGGDGEAAGVLAAGAVRDVHRGDEAGAREGRDAAVLQLRGDGDGARPARSGPRGEGAGVLRPDVSRDVQAAPELGDDGAHEPGARLGADAGAEPDALDGGARTRVHDASVDRARAEGSGRERSWPDAGGAGALRRAGGGVADECDRAHGEAAGLGVPAALQGGRGLPAPEGGDRGGRGLARVAEGAGLGREEGGAPAFVRVDRVAVHERRGADGSGDVRGARLVFNFAVRRVHTYVAGGVVVHNCHHALAPQWKAVYEAVAAQNAGWKHIGLTATPYRSAANGGTTGLGEVFEAMVFEYPIHQAIEAGDLVDLKAHRVDTQLSLAGVRLGADGDFNEDDLSRVVDIDARNDLVVQTYREHALGRPALVFCASIAHSEHMAEAFVRQGIRAKAVWGTMPGSQRDDLVRLFKERPDVLPVLTSRDLLFEGFDAPQTAAILKARPTKSRIVFVQLLGRGLRTFGVPHGLSTPEEKRLAILNSPKPHCLFFDFVDNGCELDLANLSDLSEAAHTGRTGRPLGPGDRVCRRYQDAWGVGVVDEVRPGDTYDEALVDWPASEAQPGGASSWHPVVELRRAPPLQVGEDDVVEPTRIEATATGKVYELLLLPGQKVSDPGAIGWHEYAGADGGKKRIQTWTVGGFYPGVGRIRMHVRPSPTGSTWDVWSLRPPTAAELVALGAEPGAKDVDDVCTLRRTCDSRNLAIAWANEYLRAHRAEVQPILADWKAEPISSGQIRAMKAFGLTRDTRTMSRGEAAALLDAASAFRTVGDHLDPKKAQRREFMRNKYRRDRRGGVAAGAAAGAGA